jgi:hypothetical protein
MVVAKHHRTITSHEVDNLYFPAVDHVPHPVSTRTMKALVEIPHMQQTRHQWSRIVLISLDDSDLVGQSFRGNGWHIRPRSLGRGSHKGTRVLDPEVASIEGICRQRNMAAGVVLVISFPVDVLAATVKFA